jgi:ATP-dependent Clp protease ATP-binding subunit ClpX
VGVYLCDACAILSWEAKSDDEILAGLPRMVTVSARADARIQSLVDLLRARGVALARIGAALGVTRQSAWERFSGEE